MSALQLLYQIQTIQGQFLYELILLFNAKYRGPLRMHFYKSLQFSLIYLNLTIEILYLR